MVLENFFRKATNKLPQYTPESVEPKPIEPVKQEGFLSRLKSNVKELIRSPKEFFGATKEVVKSETQKQVDILKSNFEEFRKRPGRYLQAIPRTLDVRVAQKFPKLAETKEETSEDFIERRIKETSQNLLVTDIVGSLDDIVRESGNKKLRQSGVLNTIAALELTTSRIATRLADSPAVLRGGPVQSHLKKWGSKIEELSEQDFEDARTLSEEMEEFSIKKVEGRQKAIAQSVIQNAPNMLGGLLVGLGSTLVGGPTTGVLAMFSYSAALEGGFARHEAEALAKEQGVDLNEKELDLLMVKVGFANGILETIAPAGLLSRLARTGKRKFLIEVARNIFITGIEESGTEFLQETVQNLASREVGLEKGVFENAIEAGIVGGLTGALVGGGGPVVTSVARRGAIGLSTEDINQRISELEKRKELTPEEQAELEKLRGLQKEAKPETEEGVEKQLKIGDSVEFRSPTMRSTIIKGEFVKKVDDKFIIKTKMAGFADKEWVVPLKDLQLTEVSEVKPIPKELEPLTKEVKKYNTAEEAVTEEWQDQRAMGGGEPYSFIKIGEEIYGRVIDAEMVAEDVLEQALAEEGIIAQREDNSFVLNPKTENAVFSTAEEATDALVKDAKDFFNKVKGIVPEVKPPSAKKILGIEPAPFVKFKKRETTLLKERIKRIQKSAASKADKEAAIQRLRNEFEIRLEKVTRKGELKTLQVGISERFKGIAKGVREAGVATRGTISSRLKQINQIIRESNLSMEDKGALVFSQAQLTEIKGEEVFQSKVSDIVNRIEKLQYASIKRGLITAIKKELKYTKPAKKGQRRVGKYDYEGNKFFEELREYNHLNQDDAELELSKIPEEGLSETDKIKARFLSYKANGMKGSVTLHEQVLADIREMKRLGEEAKDDADFEKLITRQLAIDDVASRIATRKGSPKSIITKAENLYREGFTNIYSMINSVAGKEMAERYDPIVAENEKETDIFYKSKKLTDDAVKIFEVKSRGQVSKIFQDMAKEEFELHDTEGLRTEISKMQLMDIYNSMKNDLVRKRYYNAFGEDQIESLLTNLTPKEMEYADKLQEMVQGYREVLNQRNIEITGRDLGMVENYWPATSEKTLPIYDDIKIQGETPSAMKERVKSSNVIPIPANAWLKAMKHMRQAEHVKHLSRQYEELKRIFTDRKVRNYITNKFGEKIYHSLNQHIDYISLNKETERTDIIASIYGKALNNWVKAKIASPTVFARQLGSVTNYMEDMPPGEWTKYFIQGIATPKETFKFMWDNFPFLEARFNRGYSEALQDAIKGANQLKTGMGSITKGTTAMVRSGDVSAIIYGGYPLVKARLAEGKTIKEIRSEFENKTLKSQQSGLTSSRSHWQNSSNPFAKTLMRFKNTLNQYARKEGDAIINYRNGEITLSKLAKITTLYFIIQPMFYVLLGWGVTEGFKAIGRAIRGEDDEPKLTDLASDIFEQIAIQPFQALPIIDDISQWAYRKLLNKKTYGVFQTPMLDEIGRSLQTMSKEEPTFRDYLDALSAIQEPGTGIPTETFLRYYDYILKGSKSKKISIPNKFEKELGRIFKGENKFTKELDKVFQ